VSVGKPVPYRVTVTNTSSGKALRVRVRMPWPDGGDKLVKCEPKADGGKEGQELIWEVGDMQTHETKTYEMAFTPKPEAKKLAGTAYVSFEYGAKVETVIDKPKISVKRTATPEVTVGELVTVRVEVTNPGTVSIPKVRLLEQAPQDAEFRGDEKAEKTAQPGQRVWDLGTLAPGDKQTVTYQLLVRQPTRPDEPMSTSSVVSAGEVGLEPARADSRTKVLQPGLSLVLTGTPATTPKAPALYKAVVRNVGTLPLGNVTLTVDVPDELEVKRRTNGAKVDRGRQTWTIAKLPPGEAQEFSVECVPQAGVAGKKLVKATARDGRGVVDTQTAETGNFAFIHDDVGNFLLSKDVINLVIRGTSIE